MGDLDENMAMEGGCCTPVRDDNVLMALLVYKPWASKLGSRRSRCCTCYDIMHALHGVHMQESQLPL